MKFRGKFFSKLSFVWILLFFFLSILPVISQTGGGVRSISMGAQYTGVKIFPGDRFDMNLIFLNHGSRGESVNVWIDKAPKGWKASIESDLYEVTGIFVPPGREETLVLNVTSPDRVKPGRYLFVVRARTEDGKISLRKNISVVVMKEEQETAEEKVTITTFFPVLKGPAKGKFEFTVIVKSNLARDSVFKLFSVAPERWNVNFKPTLKMTYISSIRLEAGQSKTLDIEIKPPATAPAGEYPIKIGLKNEIASAEATVKVVVTGSYGLKIGTAQGLLSLKARGGKSSNVSIYVKNSGSAENRNIVFTTFKPENWRVEFNPPRIALLKPNQVKQVEVIITPYEDALVGDYSVEVRAQGMEDSKDTVEFRVTVQANPLWGWIGVLIIALVILGIVATFKFFGRR